MGGLPAMGYSCTWLNSILLSAVAIFLYNSWIFFSIGSNGVVSLLHIAYSIKDDGNSALPFTGIDIPAIASYKYSMFILFCVSVPVLSVQITVAEPNVSTYCGCFTII